MLARIVLIVLVVAILFIGGNDAIQYVKAQKQLRAVSDDITRWAGENVSSMTRDQGAAQVAALAAQQGVTVFQYDQSEQGVKVWTQMPVKGTIVTGTLYNMIDGKTLLEARSAPFLITAYREAGYNVGK